MAGHIIEIWKDKETPDEAFAHFGDLSVHNQYVARPGHKRDDATLPYIEFIMNDEEKKLTRRFAVLADIDVVYLLDKSEEIRERMIRSLSTTQGAVLRTISDVVLVEWQKHVYNIYSRADAEFPREIADLWVKFEKKIGDVIQYTTEQVIGAYQERIRQITERIGDTCMDCEKTNQLILVHEDTLELLRCTEYRRQKAEAEIEEDSLDCILLCLDCWFARLKHKRINGEEAALIR